MANEVPTTESERVAFAAVLKRLVATKFGGKAKAAYTEAKVNSGTWANLVGARPAKGYSVVAVVNAFWPDADGDWRRVPGLKIERPTLTDLRARLRELESEMAAIQQQIAEHADAKPRTRLVASDAPGEIRPIPDHSATQP